MDWEQYCGLYWLWNDKEFLKQVGFLPKGVILELQKLRITLRRSLYAAFLAEGTLVYSTTTTTLLPYHRGNGMYYFFLMKKLSEFQTILLKWSSPVPGDIPVEHQNSNSFVLNHTSEHNDSSTHYIAITTGLCD